MLYSALVGVLVTQVTLLIGFWLAPELPPRVRDHLGRPTIPRLVTAVFLLLWRRSGTAAKSGPAEKARESVRSLVLLVSSLFALAFVLPGHPNVPFRFFAAFLAGGMVGAFIVTAYVLIAQSREIRRRQKEMTQLFIPSS